MKNHDENDIQFQISSENHYIYSFKEEDFIELRVICVNDRASFHLVIHVESLHIFLMNDSKKRQMYIYTNKE